jgi:hypothetical protein
MTPKDKQDKLEFLYRPKGMVEGFGKRFFTLASIEDKAKGT